MIIKKYFLNEKVDQVTGKVFPGQYCYEIIFTKASLKSIKPNKSYKISIPANHEFTYDLGNSQSKKLLATDIFKI